MNEEQLREFLKKHLKIDLSAKTDRWSGNLKTFEVSLHLVENEDDELTTDNLISYKLV